MINILTLLPPSLGQLLQDAQDAASGSVATAYDSVWAGAAVPIQEMSGLEDVMLSDDKIFCGTCRSPHHLGWHRDSSIEKRCTTQSGGTKR